MQGFNYSQLYSALQAWPKQAGDEYIAAINRLIFDAETRIVRDLDLEIFDVTDQVALAPGATTIAKPPQSQRITFTALLAQGALGGSLLTAWTQSSGSYVITFGDGEIILAKLTQGSVAVDWTATPLTAAQTAFYAQLNSAFVAERDLWVQYSGSAQPLVKRSRAFVQMYQASQGQPKYYAELDSATWSIAPAADGNATAVSRLYIQRPVSIVLAGNTFIGDNVGDALFAACLMEAEHFLKMDDRYNDMRNKYYGELLPTARGELQVAARRGAYSPLAPVASLPAPPQMPMAQPQQGQ